MASSNYSKALIGSASTIALALMVTPASAQIDEIIVTATKQERSIQDVPLSITAVTGETLVEKGVVDVLALDKLVPGLVIKNSGNDPTPILRGAGSAGTTNAAVPVYVDSMYRPRSGQALASYLDLERVEVLKGPQGTLFGRNTFGGLIDVITKKPDTSEFDWGGAVTAGNYASRRFEGFVNVPIGDQFALRVTGSDTKRDPYVENTFNPDGGLKDADETYARAQLQFEPTENLSMNLGYTYWSDTANGNADYAYKVLGIPVNPFTQQTNGVEGFLDPRQGTRDGWPGGRSQAGNVSNGDVSAMTIADPYQVAFDYAPQRDIREDSFNFNLTWDVADHQLKVNANHFDYTEVRLTDTDLSSNSALVAGQVTNSKAEQIDVNFSTTHDKALQYTVGAYYYDDSDPGDTNGAFLWGYVNDAAPQDPSWAHWLYQTSGGVKALAAYGQAEYSLTDKLRATAGLRYSKDERNSYSSGVDQSSRQDPLPSYNTDNPTITTGDDSSVDYKLGLQYDVLDDVMLYGYYATGYITGGVQQGNTGVLLEPNTNKSFELGFKSTLLDGQMRFNGAYYNQKMRGLTTTVFIQQGGTILAQSVPGGSINSQGLEFDVSYAANDQLQIDLGVSMDFSKFDEFNVGNQFTEGGDTVVGGQSFFVMDGQDTRFSPDLTFTLGASYLIDLGEMGTLLPALQLYYSSEYKATNAPYFWSNQSSYATLDLAATWTSENGLYKIRPFINNVTEELVLTEATVFSRSRAIVDYNSPRTYGVRVSRNF